MSGFAAELLTALLRSASDIRSLLACQFSTSPCFSELLDSETFKPVSASRMCRFERWTYISVDGTRYPRERLIPCDRTAGFRSCNQINVIPMNDEFEIPRSPNGPAEVELLSEVQTVPPSELQTVQPLETQIKPARTGKNKIKRDLRLEFNIHIPHNSRMKPRPRSPPSKSTALDPDGSRARFPMI